MRRRILLRLLAATPLVVAALLAAFYFVDGSDRSAAASAPPARPALNGQVTQDTINNTICSKSGWASDVRRKSVSWMQTRKRELLQQREGYRFIGAGAFFQLDHIVPIELGGAATDDSNVALQPIGEATCKDGVEHCLRAKVCKGEVSLAEAQKAIAGNWQDAKTKYCAHTKPCLRLLQWAD
jgi:hypothetical protein